MAEALWLTVRAADGRDLEVVVDGRIAGRSTTARRLAANVAGAQSCLLDDEGHPSLVNHIDRILDDLVELGSDRG